MIKGTKYYENEIMFIKDVAFQNGAMVFILTAPVVDWDDVPRETSVQVSDANALPTWWIKKAYSLQGDGKSFKELLIQAVKGELTYVPKQWLEEEKEA